MRDQLQQKEAISPIEFENLTLGVQGLGDHVTSREPIWLVIILVQINQSCERRIKGKSKYVSSVVNTEL